MKGLDGFEGHPDDSVTLFSEDDTGVVPVTEHIGCQVQVEACMLSTGEGNYASCDESETEPTKAKVFIQPITKKMR